MPYIVQARRDALKQGDMPRNAGELNFFISAVINEYWKSTGNYQGINDIVGALEGAKLEFTRQVTNPYEDTKIAQHGKLYG